MAVRKFSNGSAASATFGWLFIGEDGGVTFAPLLSDG